LAENRKRGHIQATGRGQVGRRVPTISQLPIKTNHGSASQEPFRKNPYPPRKNLKGGTPKTFWRENKAKGFETAKPTPHQHKKTGPPLG